MRKEGSFIFDVSIVLLSFRRAAAPSFMRSSPPNFISEVFSKLLSLRYSLFRRKPHALRIPLRNGHMHKVLARFSSEAPHRIRGRNCLCNDMPSRRGLLRGSSCFSAPFRDFYQDRAFCFQLVLQDRIDYSLLIFHYNHTIFFRAFCKGFFGELWNIFSASCGIFLDALDE